MKNTKNPKPSILLDTGPLLEVKKSGINLYTEYLAKHLSEEGYDIYGFYFNFAGRKKINIKSQYPYIKFIEIKHFPGIAIRPIARLFGIQFPIELFLNNKYDLHLYPNYVSYPSLKKTRQIVVTHDLCFIDHPEYLTEKNSEYLNKIMPKVIKRSDLVVCVSKFTETRVKDVYCSENTCVLTPPVVNHRFSEKKLPKGVVGKKVILFLGTAEVRKNLETLVEAMQYISNDYSLVISGNKGWKDERLRQKINEFASKGVDIVETGYVSASEKSALFQ